MLTSKGNIVAEKFFPQTSKSGAGIGRFKSVGSVIRSEVGGGAANPARHPHEAGLPFYHLSLLLPLNLKGKENLIIWVMRY
jgi:hypothetical protein